MLEMLKITISLVSTEKSFYARRVSSHRVLYVSTYDSLVHFLVLSTLFLSTYDICIIYLHVKEACLKIAISIFYLCNSKNPSDVMKNIFNSASI